MKFIHISDLHIGRRLNEYSLIKEQEHILGEIIKIIKREKPECVFIAGDVYDKSVPSAEAVSLLDSFMGELSTLMLKTFIISGNHDSAERIAYGEKVFAKNGIYISPVFDGKISKYELNDEYGRVNVYLLPFIKPVEARRYFENTESYTDAVLNVTKSLEIDENERNIIISHQFVTGSERCDSEEVSVGGMDNVDSVAYEKFDYVALGHIHKCQKVKKNIYYSGTPLKYSASEANHEKCVLVGEIKEKGSLTLTKVPLVPLRDYLDIKGKLCDVLKMANDKDFVRVTLTDEETLVDAYGKLKASFPFMTELIFERKRSYDGKKANVSIEKTPSEQFSDFYEFINGREITSAQSKIIQSLFEDIEEGEK